MSKGLGPIVGLVLTGVAVFAALVSRRPDLLHTPQFWAEDGLVCFQQAHELGFVPSLGVAYAGYLIILQRLVAGASLLLPLASAPLLFNTVGLLIQALPAVYLCSARMRDVAPLPVRLLLVVLYLGVPNVWRAHGNMTNAQWYLAMQCCLVLIASAPRSTLAAIVDVATLVIGGITGPFSLLVFPSSVYVAWRRRDAWAKRRAVLVGLGATFTLVSMQLSGNRMHPTVESLGASLPAFGRILAFRILVPVFWGDESAPWLRNPALLTSFAYAITAAGLAFMAYVFWRGGTAVRCFLLFAALALAASLASPVVSATEPQWVALQKPGTAHRYWLVPEIAVAVAVVSFTFTATRWLPRAVGALMIVTMLIVDVAQWRMPPLPDLHFDRSAAAFAALPVGQKMRIPILPNWNMTLTKTERD